LKTEFNNILLLRKIYVLEKVWLVQQIKNKNSVCRFSKTIRYFYQVLLDYYGFFIANI